MTNRAALVVAAGALAGAALLWRRQSLAELPAQEFEPAAEPGAGDPFDFSDTFEVFERIAAMRDAAHTEEAMHDTNTAAFLALIEYAEGTAVGGRDPYRTCYGYAHTIVSFADHPAVTGEWRGERLPDAMCRGAGLGPGCVSTAAGRYQFIKGTWLECKRALGLPDFSPASQDRAAIFRIARRGALDHVREGRIADALTLCRKEWASLPGAGYAGQPERQLVALLDVFERAGGTLA